jgi:hypothetical protein
MSIGADHGITRTLAGERGLVAHQARIIREMFAAIFLDRLFERLEAVESLGAQHR